MVESKWLINGWVVLTISYKSPKGMTAMSELDKRLLREIKRAKKRRGNKHRRQELNKQLRVNPEAAHEAEETFGRHSSEGLNGFDRDHTRKPVID